MECWGVGGPVFKSRREHYFCYHAQRVCNIPGWGAILLLHDIACVGVLCCYFYVLGA